MNRDFFYNWHKTTLKKHTSEVDIDAIWAAIEPEVDVINAERKRRRGFFFLLFGLCLLILGVGFISLFAPNLSPAKNHIAHSANIKLTEPNKEGTQIDNNSVAEVLTANATNTNLSTNTTKTTSDKKNTNTFLPSKISSSTKKVNDAIIQEKTRRNSTPDTTSKIHLSPSADVNQTSTISPISANNLLNSRSKINQIAKIIDEDVIAPKERLLAVDEIAIHSILPLEDEDDKAMPTAEIIVQKQNPFQFSVSIYSGIGLVNKSLSIKEGNEADEILLLRNATEKPLEVLNNGIKVGLSHKSGLNASLGFQYARVAERFQYNANFLQIDSVENQIIGYSNNLFGTRSPISGFSPNNTLHDLEYDFYNNYHFIEIPFSVGYQKRIKSWNIGLRASYIQNISLRTKGRLLNSPFEVINITDDNSLFKTRLVASFEGGLHVDYNFTPAIAVGIETYYRYIPQSISSADYSLNQNYNWIGLNASLKYSF